ncbi:MAG: hypothetical protein LBB18_01050 [Puniceicoccales bacterium]|nr:hypothetical protein [Puniceicoccales bacterium]
MELKIDGKIAHVYDPDPTALDDGFTPLIDLEGRTDWQSILPIVELDERVAKNHGLPSQLKGATNDPKIIGIVRDFLNAISAYNTFVADRAVYPPNSR